jgi:hypothetical protein
MENTLKSQPVTSENDLDAKSKRDNYTIQTIIKYTIGFAILAILLSITGIFLFKLFTDNALQQFVLSKIQENITAIVLAAFYVVGINLMKNN